MPSSFQPVHLGDGQIPASAAAIFTAGADGNYVKTFTLGAELLPTTTPVVVTLWLRTDVSAPARFWRRFSFEEGESADVLDGAQSLILEAGEQIVAEASYSDTVDYWLAGIEETFPS